MIGLLRINFRDFALSLLKLSFLLVFLFARKSNAQSNSMPYGNFSKSIITVSGEVNCDGEKLKGALVSLLKNNVKIGEITTNAEGNFSFTLKPDNNYMLIFSKDKYVSKKIFINTESIPDNMSIVRSGIDVELFKEIDGVDFSILNEPIGKFYYIASKKVIDYDKDYTNSIRDKLEELQKAVNKRKDEIKQTKASEKFAAVKSDSLDKKKQDEMLLALAKKKELEEKKKLEEEKRRLDSEKIKMEQELEKKRNKEKEDEINAIKAKNLEIKAQEEKEKAEKKEEELKLKLEQNRLRKEEEEKKHQEELALKQKEEEYQRKKNEELQQKLAKEEEAKKLAADKAWRSAQEAIEKKKLLDKEKNVQDSIKEEELKQKISSKSLKTNTVESDSLPEMSEEEAKAVFNEKLTKEEQNFILKQLAKKYPEGYTTIVRKYPNFKITTIIKVENSKADEFKMIQYKFGSFYKKNNEDITESVFKEETIGVILNPSGHK